MATLNDLEKQALAGLVVERARAELNEGRPLTEMAKPRAGEEIQTWFCEGCEEWHTGSVLGGPIGDPHGEG